MNSAINYLKKEEPKTATKYGNYSFYFHQNGIVYTQTSYIIGILTNKGDSPNIIKDIQATVENDKK